MIEEDEDFIKVSEETNDRAKKFLLRMMFESKLKFIFIPDINPGPNDGSADIYFKGPDKKFELLINVPSDSNKPISFYGDTKTGLVVKGNIMDNDPLGEMAKFLEACHAS